MLFLLRVTRPAFLLSIVSGYAILFIFLMFSFDDVFDDGGIYLDHVVVEGIKERGSLDGKQEDNKEYKYKRRRD